MGAVRDYVAQNAACERFLSAFLKAPKSCFFMKNVQICHNSLNFANFQNRTTLFDFYDPKLYYSRPNSIFEILPFSLKKIRFSQNPG